MNKYFNWIIKNYNTLKFFLVSLIVIYLIGLFISKALAVLLTLLSLTITIYSLIKKQDKIISEVGKLWKKLTKTKD